jgi:hypothetical protein
LPASPVESEIDGKSLSVFVAVARSCASFAGRTKQVLAQIPRIRRRQSEGRREDASFMPPAWVSRIEAVVAKFGDVYDSAIAARQLHMGNYSRLWNRYLCAPAAIPGIWVPPVRNPK